MQKKLKEQQLKLPRPTKHQMFAALREFLHDARTDPVWLAATAVMVAIWSWSATTLLKRAQYQDEFQQHMDAAHREVIDMHDMLELWRHSAEGTKVAGGVLTMLSSATPQDFASAAFAARGVKLSTQALTEIEIAIGDKPQDSTVPELNRMKADLLDSLSCYQRGLQQCQAFFTALSTAPKSQISALAAGFRREVAPFAACMQSNVARAERIRESYLEMNTRWQHQMAVYRDQMILNNRYQMAASLGLGVIYVYLVCAYVGWKNRLERTLRAQVQVEV